MSTRINKFLSEAGVTSRRGGDAVVAAGRVTIDGRRAVLGDVVMEGQIVTLDGKTVQPRAQKYYLIFNKPIGIITTTDPNSRDNIMDSLAAAGWPVKEKRVFPIGRLDVASGGLILITNDSEVGERMLRKEGGHEKEYLVTVDRPVEPDAIRAWQNGMEILGQMTLPAKVRMLKPDHFSIAIVQGLNRQIRRMCEAFGYEVKVLKRVRIMNLHLDMLQPGEYRELTEKEVFELRRAVGLESPRPLTTGQKPQVSIKPSFLKVTPRTERRDGFPTRKSDAGRATPSKTRPGFGAAKSRKQEMLDEIEGRTPFGRGKRPARRPFGHGPSTAGRKRVYAKKKH